MYGENWDKYYHRTYRQMRQKALWDVPPTEAVALDIETFGTAFRKDLPLIDLGCGTGTQTEYLSRHFDKVLGVDTSAEAIRIAEEQFEEPDGFSFAVLDATDPTSAQRISDELGSKANIYMRGVLHQIKDEDLPAFHRVVHTLVGKNGLLYGIEVGESIRTYFEESEARFSELPARMRQVFISNLPPRGLSAENLTHYFPEDQFELISSGPGHLNTILKFPDGATIRIPAHQFLIKSLA